MIPDLHPDIRIQKLTIGVEHAPLVVIDNFVADPDGYKIEVIQRGGRFG